MPGDPFAALPDNDRFPKSARILDGWARDAQKLVGSRGERVGWILASTIVVAALQRELRDGAPVFLLKGGVFIERTLDLNARTTKDVDTLYRGAEEDLADHIDRALAEPWGEITFSRTPIEIIEKAKRVIKPRRFKVRLDIRGVRWRSIQVEASFAEGSSGQGAESLPAPSTGFSALTDPTTSPRSRWAISSPRSSTLARTPTTRRLGYEPRQWPPVVAANDVWRGTWHIPAGQVGLDLTLDEAITIVNDWIGQIAEACVVGG